MIAINDAYRLAPWADVLYACDADWWKWHDGVPTFTGPKYALQRRANVWPGVTVLENTGVEGLEHQPFGLRNGRNGGYQAINLAVHYGASRIVLLGYDMQARRGKSHWFGEHPTHVRPPFDLLAAAFPTLVEPLRSAGVTVLNATRETALTCFDRVSLAEALS